MGDVPAGGRDRYEGSALLGEPFSEEGGEETGSGGDWDC